MTLSGYTNSGSAASYLMGHLCEKNKMEIYPVQVGRADARGLGSVRSDERDSMTLKSDRAGDQFCLRISIHMPPLSEIFMWYILSPKLASIRRLMTIFTYLVAKVTLGAENLGTGSTLEPGIGNLRLTDSRGQAEYPH